MTRPALADRAARVRTVIYLAIWAAFWAGTVQAAYILFDQYVLHHVAYASRDVAWMAQLSYLAIFAPAAALIVLGALFSERAVWSAVVLFSGSAVFCLLLPFGGVSKWAALVLALGVSVACVRLAVANAPRFLRAVRIQAWALTALMLAAFLFVRAGGPIRERVQVSALPEARDGAPNVLLIILDTVRAASVSLYGYERPTTPRLEALAKDGVMFENAFSTAPWTLPSHASMFTGRYASEVSANYVDALDERDATLAEVFASRGYLTGGFVANHNYTGFDTGLARGFQRYEDYKLSPLQVWRTSWAAQALFAVFPEYFDPGVDDLDRADYLSGLRLPPNHWTDLKRAQEVNREFLDWRASAPERPYFAFLNYFDAHKPRFAPHAIRRKFAAQRPIRDRYNSAINYLDRSVGELLDSLQARGELDHTIVIVASDHGELFGEHDIWGHANSLYLNVLRVPMVIRYPAGLPRGQRVTQPVSLRDLGATVLDLTGVQAAKAFPGVSLGPLARGVAGATASPVRAFANRTINLPAKFPASRGDLRAAIDARLHYIRNDGDGSEELFEWAADSAEARNLARTPEGMRVLPTLREAAGVPTPPVAARERR